MKGIIVPLATADLDFLKQNESTQVLLNMCDYYYRQSTSTVHVQYKQQFTIIWARALKVEVNVCAHEFAAVQVGREEQVAAFEIGAHELEIIAAGADLPPPTPTPARRRGGLVDLVEMVEVAILLSRREHEHHVVYR